MVSIYRQLRKKAAHLEARALQLRQAEITRIVELMREYNVSLAEIGYSQPSMEEAPSKAFSPVRRGRPPLAVPKPVRKAPPAKYRNEAGETWSGYGRPPGWMRDALAAGGRRDDYLIR